MSSLSIGFDKSKFNDALLNSKVTIQGISGDSILPKKIIKFQPQSFVLKEEESIQNINILIPSLVKLNKVKGINKFFPQGIPENIDLRVTQITQGMPFEEDVEIPLQQ